MESEVKNSISQQAEQSGWAEPSRRNIPESVIKGLGHHWNNNPAPLPHKIKYFLTALEQKHSSCTSSIHGQESLTYTCNEGRLIL